ncbi:MAG TPA: acyl-CoA dehydrogenase [Polyangiaceae bacterium]|nr:acyl-CoA dehydrogenase [Polyangiaceae bacterium]
MDFSWSDDQIELHDRLRRFAEEHLEDTSAADDSHRFSRCAFSRCGELGVLGLCVPTEYGGLGASAVTTARALEGLAEGGANGGLMFALCAHLFACTMPIVEQGTLALREAWVSELAHGRAIGANAITEAEAGSDVFALKTRAVRDGDHYVLEGTKSYVSNGPVADLFLVYASVEPAHGYLGVAAFAVERDRPGLRVGEPFDKLGLESCPTSALYLDGCRVPASHRVGAEGEGAAVFRASMAWERSCLFAIYLGIMARQIRMTIDHATIRRQFRKPIGKHQAVAHRIADMKLRLEAARLLLYRACWLRDQQQDATLETALAKLAISEAAIQSALDAIQIHGGMGVMKETGLAQMLADAVPSTIFSGTSEIQRDLVAARLGL